MRGRRAAAHHARQAPALPGTRGRLLREILPVWLQHHLLGERAPGPGPRAGGGDRGCSPPTTTETPPRRQRWGSARASPTSGPGGGARGRPGLQGAGLAMAGCAGKERWLLFLKGLGACLVQVSPPPVHSRGGQFPPGGGLISTPAPHTSSRPGISLKLRQRRMGQSHPSPPHWHSSLERLESQPRDEDRGRGPPGPGLGRRNSAFHCCQNPSGLGASPPLCLLGWHPGL